MTNSSTPSTISLFTIAIATTNHIHPRQTPTRSPPPPSAAVRSLAAEPNTDRADSAPPESVENEESTVTTENDVRVGDSVESVDSLGVLFFSYMIIVDPFRTIKRGREFLLLKLYNLCKLNCGFVSPLVSGLLKEHESVWKLVFRIGWGLFWGIYVGFILISGLFIRYFVEEPIQIKETLNFDYEENSPVALIPLMSSYGASCGFNCEENKESRVVPIGHKLQVTVILTLPESEYNRNLGFFSRMRGFMEENVPTSCIKVKIEQRAELWLGAGTPCTPEEGGSLGDLSQRLVCKPDHIVNPSPRHCPKNW
ncbi:hypothetical protein QYF36_006202 [Acer negundo]|nr:hypothetical protein QYF36_006202 [Acer negundo]